MTRKQAVKIERELKALGVYKPFVSCDGDLMFIESYLLTVIVQDGGCDPEMGPATRLKLTDSSLSCIGQDPIITTCRIFWGQDLTNRVAQLLVDFHEPAYARASAQDKAALSDAKEINA